MTMNYQIPGLVQATEAASTLLRSQTTGAVVDVVANEDGDNVHNLTFPAFDGHEEMRGTYDDIMDLEDEYVVQWVRWAAVTIGVGFHPDTPAEDYDPPLESALAEEYDALLKLSHGYADPYETAVDAWEAAGIVEPSEKGPVVVTKL
jgi:hypothetical protein